MSAFTSASQKIPGIVLSSPQDYTEIAQNVLSAAGLNSHIPRVSQVDQNDGRLQMESRNADAPKFTKATRISTSGCRKKDLSSALGSSSTSGTWVPGLHLRSTIHRRKEALGIRSSSTSQHFATLELAALSWPPEKRMCGTFRHILAHLARATGPAGPSASALRTSRTPERTDLSPRRAASEAFAR